MHVWSGRRQCVFSSADLQEKVTTVQFSSVQFSSVFGRNLWTGHVSVETVQFSSVFGRILWSGACFSSVQSVSQFSSDRNSSVSEKGMFQFSQFSSVQFSSVSSVLTETPASEKRACFSQFSQSVQFSSDRNSEVPPGEGAFQFS